MSLIDARTAVIYLGNSATLQQKAHVGTIANALTELSDRLDAMEQIIMRLAEKIDVGAADVLSGPQPQGAHASSTGYQSHIQRILG
jgi:hypothetical protein